VLLRGGPSERSGAAPSRAGRAAPFLPSSSTPTVVTPTERPLLAPLDAEPLFRRAAPREEHRGAGTSRGEGPPGGPARTALTLAGFFRRAGGAPSPNPVTISLLRTSRLLLLVLAPAFVPAPVAQPRLAFERMETPNPSPRFNVLRGVDGVGTRDAWAVGDYDSGPDPQHPITTPLILHWDGEAWAQMPDPPRPDQYKAYLWSVEAITLDEAWAVGIKTRFGAAEPYLLRWDGTAWQDQGSPPLPAPENGQAALFDVFAVGPDDLWIVGAKTEGAPGPLTRGYTARRSGGEWVPFLVPAVGNRTNELEAVHGSAPDNVWTVGVSRTITEDFHPLVARWTGSAWAIVSTPFDGRGIELYDVETTGPDDVWIAGAATTGGAFVAHWDGAAWAEISAPSIGSFAVIASDDIYGFGGPISHWDGEAWAVVDDLSDLSSPSFRSAASVVMPDGRLWAAGRTIDADVFHTLVVRSADPVTTDRYDDPTVPVGAEPAAPGERFVLRGPTPNPARARAALVLTLGEPTNVRVEAFDALGRRVAVLLDGALGAGTHPLTLDASALPPGVYLVRATGAGLALSRTVTVAR
jgi:hypothetical protein